MPKFVDQKPQLPEPKLREVSAPRVEPAGLEAFASRAAVTPPPAADKGRGRGRTLPSSPMPVRFPPDVKAALERLSEHDDRSQQQILERIAFPALLEAARKLP